MVTDSNPHLEGLLDQHRIVYMPYSEEKNVVMELPSSPGLFFSSQLISGGELVIAFDRSLHKYWALHINQVYTPPKVITSQNTSIHVARKDCTLKYIL